MLLLFAGAVFFASLLLICLLFALKVREMETGRRFAPALRDAADREALHVKSLLFAVHADLKKVPPLLVHWGHVVLHFVVIEFARATRAASLSAHAFAKFVSEKRNFRRRQTSSEFLRAMSERRRESKGGNAPPPDENLDRGPDL